MKLSPSTNIHLQANYPKKLLISSGVGFDAKNLKGFNQVNMKWTNSHHISDSNNEIDVKKGISIGEDNVMENVFFINKKNLKLQRRKRRKFKTGYHTAQLKTPVRDISLENEEKLPKITNSSAQRSEFSMKQSQSNFIKNFNIINMKSSKKEKGVQNVAIKINNTRQKKQYWNNLAELENSKQYYQVNLSSRKTVRAKNQSLNSTKFNDLPVSHANFTSRVKDTAHSQASNYGNEVTDYRNTSSAETGLPVTKESVRKTHKKNRTSIKTMNRGLYEIKEFDGQNNSIHKIPQPRRKIQFSGVRIYQGARANLKNKQLQKKQSEEESAESSNESSSEDTSSTEDLISVEEEKKVMNVRNRLSKKETLSNSILKGMTDRIVQQRRDQINPNFTSLGEFKPNTGIEKSKEYGIINEMLTDCIMADEFRLIQNETFKTKENVEEDRDFLDKIMKEIVSPTNNKEDIESGYKQQLAFIQR